MKIGHRQTDRQTDRQIGQTDRQRYRTGKRAILASAFFLHVLGDRLPEKKAGLASDR